MSSLVRKLSIKEILIFSSFLFFVLTSWFNIKNNLMSHFYIIPFIYLITVLLLYPQRHKYNYGYYLLLIVQVIRFNILPFFHSFNDISIYDPSIENNSILLISAEIIITGITIYLFSRYYNEKSKNFNYEFNANNFIMLSIFIIFLFFYDTNLIKSFNFILRNDITLTNDSNLGILLVIVNHYKNILILFLTVYYFKKYKNARNIIYFYWSLLIIAFSLLFFQGEGRSDIIIYGIAFTGILMKLYPEFKKRILLSIGATLFMTIITITLVRFFNNESVSDIGLLEFVSSLALTLDSYFSGINNISHGLVSINKFGSLYNINTFFKDIFANVVVMNKIVQNQVGTVYYFNYTIYNHTLWADQISPLITQSIALFKGFGILIPSLVTFVILLFDVKAKNEENVYFVFLYSIISLKFAFYSHGNLTILSSYIFNTAMTLFVILRFLNKRKVKKKELKNERKDFIGFTAYER